MKYTHCTRAMCFTALLTASSVIYAVEPARSNQAAAGDPPEMLLIIGLRGIAAGCEITNLLAVGEARKKDTIEAYEAASNTASKCVDDGLSAGRGKYRSAIGAAPGSKAMLAEVYAAWLQYMDKLRLVSDDEAQDRAQESFDKASALIRAELDSR